MQAVKSHAPGIAAAFVMALAAKCLESLLPTRLISASVLGLFTGMLLNRFWCPAWRLLWKPTIWM